MTTLLTQDKGLFAQSIWTMSDVGPIWTENISWSNHSDCDWQWLFGDLDMMVDG